jgi:hypothetical protein
LVALALAACGGKTQNDSESDDGSSSTIADGATESESDDDSGSEDESTSGLPKLDVGGDGDGDGEIPPAPDFPETCEEAATVKTSVGCTFYPLAVPQSYSGNGGTTSIVVSNVSDQVATVTLSDRNGQIQQVQVASGQIHTFVDQSNHILPATTGIYDRGMVVESDEVLQVFQFSPPYATVTADASLVFPDVALGTKHRAAVNNDFDTIGNQYVAIVAPEDDTEVTFTLVAPATITLAGNPVPILDSDMGQDTYQTTLNALDVLVIAANNDNPDTMMPTNQLTGSLIESDKPVAVYAGNTPTYVPPVDPDFFCCADLISDMVPPTTVYGTRYAAVKFLPQKDEKDVWRFMGNADGTEITLSGGIDEVIQLDEGEFADRHVAEPFWAQGNAAFGMVHFMTGSEYAMWEKGEDDPMPYDCAPIDTPGDPAIGWVIPIGNWLNRYQFPVGPTISGNWCNDHATVVASLDDWDDITFNGNALPAVTQIGQSAFGYAYVPADTAIGEVLAPEGVGVMVDVYGYVDDGSYYYPGGMGLQDLNPEG